MLVVNQTLSGNGDSIGAAKLRVVLESESRNELESAKARQMAFQIGDQHGFGNAGLSENPTVVPVEASTDEELDNKNALDPSVEISKYRAEFILSKRP